MVPTLKAEFKKLITVRSTYLMVLLALFLSGLFTYFGTSQTVYEEVAEPTGSNLQSAGSDQQGTNNQPPPPEARTLKVSKDLPKEKFLSNLQESIPVVSLFIAVVVVLLMAHEFRHNTITYTLTASNSRSKVLVSKIFVSTIFTIIVALLVILTVTAATYAAVNIKDLNLPPQYYDWLYILARLVGYALGFSLISLAIIALVRNITAGIVALFLLPTIDAIAGELLKNWDIEATKYLPFSALNRVSNVVQDYIPRNIADDGVTDMQLLPATVAGATAVFALYLIGTWVVSWYLFLRRDAV